FEATAWVSNSAELVRQMTAVFCLGGETQIRKVLRHAISETKRKKVNAVVFVGDCCEEDVDKLCALAGELGLLNVPVFVFHEGGELNAARAFRQIVKLTKGAYCQFDSSSAKQLRDLLSAVAVYAAGGRKALESYSRKADQHVALLTKQIR
ncbi:MAG: VWA domain-containing protein, partial [Proteobacteria bacterium]|nr:VWA domain-containing protein [Pseudomonadota bacterium]